MTTNSQTKLLKEVTCPFCSLLCDDLEIRNRAGRLKLERNGCPKAARGFEFNAPEIGPHIRGNECSLEEAITHAAEILGRARQPLISGLGTDVAGSRAAIHLAETTGAILDHGQGDGPARNALVMQSGGWILTTLAEVKNRADLIVFIGTDLNRDYPRFYERFVWDQPSLAGLKKNARELIYIGNKLNTHSGTSPNGKKASVVNCPDEELGETVSLLRCLLKGTEVKADSVARGRLAHLRKVADQIKAAEYGVFIWAPGELTQPYGELLIQTICDMVKELNRESRYAGLSLGGSNGGMTFVNVCTWQSGYPSRISFAKGYPEYDPYHHSTAEMLKRPETDALLWISSLHEELTPPGTGIPTIILSRPSTTHARDAQVYIPVGTPGIDHMGNLLRTDVVVTLPLQQLRQPLAHSVSDILTRIRQAL